jgi:predicted Zn-dependent protease
MRIDGSLIIRAVAVLAALVVCAWFAVGIRQAHDVARASAILSGASTLSADEANRATSLLHSARFLNPDTSIDLLLAQLAATRGDVREAERIMLKVVREEPMNAKAWLALASYAGQLSDTPTFVRAARALIRLAPKPRSTG